MENKFFRFSLVMTLCIFCSSVLGQNIKGHYVSRPMSDGVLYHTMPVTLFENDVHGDLTFDLTYKQNSNVVTMNLTYKMKQPIPADSVQFVNGATVISGKVEKIYLNPDRNIWKHRYTLTENLEKFDSFFSDKGVTEAIVFSNGTAYCYKVKKSVWASYVPIGLKIFEMIKFNEEVQN